MASEDEDDDWIHKECGTSRTKRDQTDVRKLVEQLDRFQVFHYSNANHLICLTTGDVATGDMESGMMKAHEIGNETVLQFVQERIISKEKCFMTPSRKTT